ncbi:MAG: diacylglycerol kinase [Alcaligenaceae bacterium]|nr:diacylglycerol kinase [Alcaligenaceae bacterium]
MHSPYKSKGGFSRLLNALRYSRKGLAAAFRHEAAFRQELFAATILCPLAFFAGGNTLEILLLIASLALVLIVELLNSGLEAIADAVSVDHHPLIERAKDLGSAAVFLSILLALFVWAGVLLT